MAKDSEKIRLPELPVFKKYSLALRQEFASVDEILAVLDRTSTKIRDTVDRADEERRRQEASRVMDPEEIEESPEQGDPELQLDFPEELEDVDRERPFWEEPGAEEADEVLARADNKAPQRVPRARPKPKKKARPAIVPVGDLGKPIGTGKQPSKKKAVTKNRSKKPVAKSTQLKRSTTRPPGSKKKAKSATRAKARPRTRSSDRKR